MKNLSNKTWDELQKLKLAAEVRLINAQAEREEVRLSMLKDEAFAEPLPDKHRVVLGSVQQSLLRKRRQSAPIHRESQHSQQRKGRKARTQ